MLVKTESDFILVVNRLNSAKWVVFDTETSGLDIWGKDKMCGIGFCFENEDTFYLPFRHRLNAPSLPLLMGLVPPNENLPINLLPSLWRALREVPTIVAHNGKFDLAAMHKDGYEMPLEQELIDTISIARLVYPGKHPPLNLEQLTADLIGQRQADYKKQFRKYLKKNGWEHNYDFAPADKVGPYCEDDCLSTKQIWERLMVKIKQTQQERVELQERDVIKTCWEMEKTGFYYDKNYLDQTLPKVNARIQMILNSIYQDVGYEFNPLSGKDLDKAMKHIGIEGTKIGKNGYCSWDTAELMKINHNIASKIIELRGLEKVKSTYLESLFKWKDQVIHCHFKPWGTGTGRMSGENPNLQNLTRGVQNLLGDEMSEEVMNAFKAMMGAYQGQTVDSSAGAVSSLTTGTVKGLTSKFSDEDEMTIAVRRLYIPRPGYKLYFYDFEQMEMRVFADYVDDPALSELLETSGFDFHSHAAKEVWGVNEKSELWDFYRTLAKAVNFGLIFQIGITKLAAQIQKSEDEARQYKAEYFGRFPKSSRFIKDVMNMIETRGWIKNRFGRRYEIPAEDSYIGINYLVQGTSADIVKNRMVACDKFLRQGGYKSRLINQVHDELIFEFHKSEEYDLIVPIKEIIEERQIKTFLPVDVSVGMPSMAQKKKICMKCLQPKIENKEKGEFHVCDLEKKPNRKFKFTSTDQVKTITG